MTETSKAAVVLSMFRDAGAKPYPVMSGHAHTVKMARFVLPNGRPVAIETNYNTPNVWLLPEHERGIFRDVGKPEHYEAGRGRHSNLNQIREFVGQALTKIPITSESAEDIRAAIIGVTAPASRL